MSQVIDDLSSTDAGVSKAVAALKLGGQSTVAGVNSGLGTQAFPPGFPAGLRTRVLVDNPLATYPRLKETLQ